jgi:hypothetical protein
MMSVERFGNPIDARLILGRAKEKKSSKKEVSSL